MEKMGEPENIRSIADAVIEELNRRSRSGIHGIQMATDSVS